MFHQGNFAKDPYRAGLGSAIQWYSNLRACLRRETDAVLENTQKQLLGAQLLPDHNTDASATSAPVVQPDAEASRMDDTTHSDASLLATPSQPAESNDDESSPLKSGRAHRILRERCPACFGLNKWGRPLSE